MRRPKPHGPSVAQRLADMALRQAQKKPQPTIRYADYDGEVRLPDDIGLKDGDELLDPSWRPVSDKPGLFQIGNTGQFVQLVTESSRFFDTVQKEEDR